MTFSRSTIAATVTVFALGLLAAVALAAGGSEKPTSAAPAPVAETDPPVDVRTKVIRRTIHRRPKAPAAAAAAPASITTPRSAPAPAGRVSRGNDDGTADQGPGDAPGTAASHDDWDDDSGHGGSDDWDDNSGHGGGDDWDDDDHGSDDDDDGGGGHGRGRGRGRGGDDDD
jgi:hypothetical protein